MSKNFEKVYSQHIIEEDIIKNIPKEQLPQMIITKLANDIAHHIADNIDNLPVEYAIENVDQIYSKAERHTLSFNIISNEEIIRLRWIEERFLALQMEYSDFIVRVNKNKANI